jgi:hypothetical protein
MSKIDGQVRQAGAGVARADEVPWSPEASANVRGLRRAITAHRADVPVDSEVASMMPTLLKRLDVLVGGARAQALPAPAVPNPADPPGAEGLMRGLGQVSDAVRGRLRGLSGQDAQAQRLGGLLKVLDAHLEMRHEVILRAGMGRG